MLKLLVIILYEKVSSADLQDNSPSIGSLKIGSAE
jgi:hypothetical protein